MRKASAAKRVGLEPSVTLRVMCRTKTSICTAEREELPGIMTGREEATCFYLDKNLLVGAGASGGVSEKRRRTSKKTALL